MLRGGEGPRGAKGRGGGAKRGLRGGGGCGVKMCTFCPGLHVQNINSKVARILSPIPFLLCKIMSALRAN